MKTTINAEALENLLVEICAQPILYSSKLAELIGKVFTTTEERWEPKKLEIYWFVNANGEAMYAIWIEDSFDIQRLAFGNAFQTESEALARVEAIKKLK